MCKKVLVVNIDLSNRYWNKKLVSLNLILLVRMRLLYRLSNPYSSDQFYINFSSISCRYILPFITQLVNYCLQEGIFPQILENCTYWSFLRLSKEQLKSNCEYTCISIIFYWLTTDNLSLAHMHLIISIVATSDRKTVVLCIYTEFIGDN